MTTMDKLKHPLTAIKQTAGTDHTTGTNVAGASSTTGRAAESTQEALARAPEVIGSYIIPAGADGSQYTTTTEDRMQGEGSHLHQLDEQPVRSTMQTGPKGSFRNDQLQTGNELGAALKTAGAGPDSTFSEATTAVMPGHNTKRVGPDHQASGREKVAGASSFATGPYEVAKHALKKVLPNSSGEGKD